MNTHQKKTIKWLSQPNLYITQKVREFMKIRDYWQKLACNAVTEQEIEKIIKHISLNKAP